MVVLLPVRQRYKNESKSQPMATVITVCCRCCQYDKDTKMKANHNCIIIICIKELVVASTTKIQKWKQITTDARMFTRSWLLLPVRQRYKNESKSQPFHIFVIGDAVVASTTKIQKWKQITTEVAKLIIAFKLLPVRQRYKNESKSQPQEREICSPFRCCQYDKDTKMKANHNWIMRIPRLPGVVASTTKIQKWKQITTSTTTNGQRHGCCQYDKDTKMKANHNTPTRFARPP